MRKSKKERTTYQFCRITVQFGRISEEESLKPHEDSAFLVSGFSFISLKMNFSVLVNYILLLVNIIVKGHIEVAHKSF